jgi:hypothetical protein
VFWLPLIIDDMFQFAVALIPALAGVVTAVPIAPSPIAAAQKSAPGLEAATLPGGTRR